eukprot:symbB.v1.2.014098.t1/scaffold1021.1/size143647/3
MVERAIVLVRDLRELNVQRKERNDAQRGKFFRVHCISKLREVCLALQAQIEDSWVSSLESLVHHAELALISGNGPDDLEESLRFLEAELYELQQEVLQMDRCKLEHLKTLRGVCGAKVSPGKQLLKIQIQTLGGAAFEVSCSLDESPLHLKQYICSSGGPLVRDQKLLWNRSELSWIHQSLNASQADSFSLFYLGILDGDSATLYYVRYCYQCEGPCSCVECHGLGTAFGCESCGVVKKPCHVCQQACRCPICHGDPAGQELHICKACGECASDLS